MRTPLDAFATALAALMEQKRVAEAPKKKPRQAAIGYTGELVRFMPPVVPADPRGDAWRSWRDMLATIERCDPHGGWDRRVTIRFVGTNLEDEVPLWWLDASDPVPRGITADMDEIERWLVS